MGNSFCSDFWVNFLANFSAGLIVGGVLALWVGRKINELARIEERREEKKAQLENAIRYLQFLKEEVDGLLQQLPRLTEIFGETGWGREIRIPTPYWNVLVRSGELPKLINPDLLGLLAQFYDHVAYAKRGRDLTIDSWLVPQPDTVPGMELKLAAFVRMTQVGLEQTLKSGKALLGKLDSEIQVLRKQVETL